jgi:UDP-N-acetylmuramoylalanine--D-glutamate ligase
LIGEDAENIESQLKGIAPIAHAESMKAAVRGAFERSKSGDTVLLAPACASFDMFKSFEERGRVFKEIIAELAIEFPDAKVS